MYALLAILLFRSLTGNSQPTLPRFAWEHDLGFPPGNPGVTSFLDLTGVAKLSPTRIVYNGAYLANNVGGPALIFVNPQGDTTVRSFPQFISTQNIGYFNQIAADPIGSFLTASQYARDTIGQSGVVLMHFDSLGTYHWQSSIITPSAFGASGTLGYTRGSPLRIPDGYLLTLDFSEPDPPYLRNGVLVKTDRRGREQYRTTLALQERFSYSPTPILPSVDGSYVVAASSPYRYPPPHNIWDLDLLLMRLLPSGDTVQPTFFGARHTFESLYGLAPTPDNGVIVAGSQREYRPSGQPRPSFAWVAKFDSLFRQQWRVRRPAGWSGSGVFEGGAVFEHVHVLQNGHYLAAGLDAVLNPGSTTDYHFEGVYAEIAPPAGTGPADTVGVIVREWRTPRSFPRQLLPQPGDSTAYVRGRGRANESGESYIAKLTGLVPPLVLPLCARPPVLGQAPTWQAVAGQPDSLRFSLDAAATRPGPRYGAVALVEWDFGDGSPVVEGWQVAHRFATPTPVRVRVCVTNNLWCKTCAEVFPFGPGAGVGLPEDVAASAPAVSVFPNPSATGRFTVRVAEGAPAGAAYAVLDATGRTVATGRLNEPQTALDLRAAPTGVYALRLRWPDGRALTRRLVRW